MTQAQIQAILPKHWSVDTQDSRVMVITECDEPTFEVYPSTDGGTHTIMIVADVDKIIADLTEDMGVAFSEAWCEKMWEVHSELINLQN